MHRNHSATTLHEREEKLDEETTLVSNVIVPRIEEDDTDIHEASFQNIVKYITEVAMEHPGMLFRIAELWALASQDPDMLRPEEVWAKGKPKGDEEKIQKAREFGLSMAQQLHGQNNEVIPTVELAEERYQIDNGKGEVLVLSDEEENPNTAVAVNVHLSSGDRSYTPKSKQAKEMADVYEKSVMLCSDRGVRKLQIANDFNFATRTSLEKHIPWIRENVGTFKKDLLEKLIQEIGNNHNIIGIRSISIELPERSIVKKRAGGKPIVNAQPWKGVGTGTGVDTMGEINIEFIHQGDDTSHALYLQDNVEDFQTVSDRIELIGDPAELVPMDEHDALFHQSAHPVERGCEHKIPVDHHGVKGKRLFDNWVQLAYVNKLNTNGSFPYYKSKYQKGNEPSDALSNVWSSDLQKVQLLYFLHYSKLSEKSGFTLQLGEDRGSTTELLRSLRECFHPRFFDSDFNLEEFIDRDSGAIDFDNLINHYGADITNIFSNTILNRDGHIKVEALEDIQHLLYKSHFIPETVVEKNGIKEYLTRFFSGMFRAMDALETTIEVRSHLKEDCGETGIASKVGKVVDKTIQSLTSKTDQFKPMMKTAWKDFSSDKAGGFFTEAIQSGLLDYIQVKLGTDGLTRLVDLFIEAYIQQNYAGSLVLSCENMKHAYISRAKNFTYTQGASNIVPTSESSAKQLVCDGLVDLLNGNTLSSSLEKLLFVEAIIRDLHKSNAETFTDGHDTTVLGRELAIHGKNLGIGLGKAACFIKNFGKSTHTENGKRSYIAAKQAIRDVIDEICTDDELTLEKRLEAIDNFEAEYTDLIDDNRNYTGHVYINLARPTLFGGKGSSVNVETCTRHHLENRKQELTDQIRNQVVALAV